MVIKITKAISLLKNKKNKKKLLLYSRNAETYYQKIYNLKLSGNL